MRLWTLTRGAGTRAGNRPSRVPARAVAVHRAGRVGLGLVGTSFALVWLVALAGPSVASRHGVLDLGLSPWLVTAVLATAIGAGAAGIATAWSAVRRGWAPDPRRLLAGGLVAVAAFTAVPPVTSDDVYSYAAYGRLAALGRDPYTTAPDQLHDPVGDAVGDPWRRSPSIYGPVATAEQALVMRLAGRSPRAGAWLLSLVSAAAMAVSGLILHRLAGDPERQRRAALLFGLNPLVVVPVVAGAHVDALLVLALVGAVALVRRNAAAAGAVAGAAVCVKLTGVLAAAGLLWWLRRTPGRAVQFAAAAALVVLPAYLATGGWRATEQARRASRFVSYAVPWRVLTPHLSRPVIGLLALAAVAGLAVLLHRGLPGSAAPARAALVPVLAWLLGATYLLPWYDAWGWCLLALLAWSRWDEVLLAHTTVLTLAYLPGRTVPLPPALADLLTFTRRTAAPVLLGAAVLYAIRLATRASPAAAAARASAAGRRSRTR